MQVRQQWTDEDIQALPPMPKPEHVVRLSEATCGCTVVIGLIVLFVSMTESVASTMPPGSYLSLLGRIAIWTETIVALFCLFGLMFGVRA